MAEKVLMKGNEALAEAAIQAGCRHYFGYPITPQTEIAAYMSRRLPKVGGVFLQAESEISAINMVYGVSGTGARVMTSSSSPGVSLKSEGLSYLAGCDLPAVIVNIQRGGPGLGGIQPSQADYFQATRGGGHGDYHLLVFAPASVQEMADMTMKAFDLAEKYRMPAMILSDGFLGQMMEPVEMRPYERPEFDNSWAVTGTQMKRGHNIINSLYLDPELLDKVNHERYERYEIIKQNEAMCEEIMMEDAEICVSAYGITARVAQKAVMDARSLGIKVGMLRPLTVWPFPEKAFLKSSERVKAYISVEMSMGQMIDDIRLSVQCRRPVHLCGRTGGVIPSAEQVLLKIKELAGGEK